MLKLFQVGVQSGVTIGEGSYEMLTRPLSGSSFLKLEYGRQRELKPISLTMLLYMSEVCVSVINLKNWGAELFDTTKRVPGSENKAKPGKES